MNSQNSQRNSAWRGPGACKGQCGCRKKAENRIISRKKIKIKVEPLTYLCMWLLLQITVGFHTNYVYVKKKNEFVLSGRKVASAVEASGRPAWTRQGSSARRPSRNQRAGARGSGDAAADPQREKRRRGKVRRNVHTRPPPSRRRSRRMMALIRTSDESGRSTCARGGSWGKVMPPNAVWAWLFQEVAPASLMLCKTKGHADGIVWISINRLGKVALEPSCSDDKVLAYCIHLWTSVGLWQWIQLYLIFFNFFLLSFLF